jgi:hypothetical protein
MAVYNEILAGRFNRALQKLFSMKGGAPAAALGGDIQAALEFPLTEAEDYLWTLEPFGLGATQAAVAAVSSGIRFRNPLTSGIVCIIDSLTTSVVGAADTFFLDIGPTSADLTTLTSSPNPLDARGNAQSPIIGSRSNTVSAPGIGGSASDVIALVAATSWQWCLKRGFPLLPGWAIQVRNNTVNTAQQTGMRWRQRPLEDSEKT